MSSHEFQYHDIPTYSAPQMLNVRVGLIGAGRVGLSLAMALQRLNALEWLVVRSPQRRDEIALAFGDGIVVSSCSAIESVPDIIIICTPDTTIRTVAEELAMHHGSSLSGCLILHCSGSLGVDVLHVCTTVGAGVAATHPFQTFTHAHERLLTAISWGIECEPDQTEYVGAFIRTLGGTPVFLSEYTRQHKALYHISAVMASNYVEAAIAAAQEAAHAAQIQATTFLQPIIQSAIESAFMSMAHNGAPPLTGPIARGDIETIRRHLLALAEHPELQKQYCHLGLATVEFAFNQSYIDQDTAILIREELQSAVKNDVG